jgi:hypothetical protein
MIAAQVWAKFCIPSTPAAMRARTEIQFRYNDRMNADIFDEAIKG